MNWDDVRFLLALAKAGSLAAAARELKVDHTTVGRRVETLECDLGVGLFARGSSGYVLTPAALDLLPELRRVEAAVHAVERAVKARDEGLSGTLRVTTADTFGSRYVAPRLVPFARKHPELTIDLVTSSAAVDLGRLEADLAIRLFRSKQEDLVVRRAADFAYAMYGSEEYLRRHPAPASPEDLATHDLVLDDFTGRLPTDVTWPEQLGAGARIAFRTNNTMAALCATLEGLGLGVLPRYLADAEPTLRHVPMPDEPMCGIWLTVHRDMAQSRSVRALLDHLTGVLRADAAMLRGGAPR